MKLNVYEGYFSVNALNSAWQNIFSLLMLCGSIRLNFRVVAMG